jgi:hypothetical protein
MDRIICVMTVARWHQDKELWHGSRPVVTSLLRSAHMQTIYLTVVKRIRRAQIADYKPLAQCRCCVACEVRERLRVYVMRIR